MLKAEQLDRLPELPGPVLTAYLDVNPGNLRNQRGGGRSPAAIWMRDRARYLAAGLPAPEARALRREMRRLDEFLSASRAGAKSLVAFSGPRAWEVLRLEVAVEEELYWGPPALGQLLWLADEHQPCGAVAIERSGARFFRFWMGEAWEEPPRPFSIDRSQWRPRTLVMGVGVEVENYRQRETEHFERFYREVAAQSQAWARRRSLRPLVLLGGTEAVDGVRDAFPAAWRRDLIVVSELPSGSNASEIAARVGPELERWRREQESGEVEQALGAAERGEAVTGVDATLAALQEGRIRRLLVSRDLRGRVRLCPRCGWVDRSPQIACPQCGAGREAQSLRAMLPLLARKFSVPVAVVAGGAAGRLAAAEGMAGWLVPAGAVPVPAAG